MTAAPSPDYADLRRKAEAVSVPNFDVLDPAFSGSNMELWSAFRRHTNPAAILALLDERTALLDRAEKAEAEAKALREALDEIANPVRAMRRRAEAEGGQLNGPMAAMLANDVRYLSDIAARALGGANG